MVGLGGQVDWDMAGPTTVEADVAWVAFSWAPLHAREVVEAEDATYQRLLDDGSDRLLARALEGLDEIAR